MRTFFVLFLLIIFLTAGESKACNVCGGGTSDIAVLALDGRMLINFGYTFDHYTGVWDQYGKWRESDLTSNQHRLALAFAYRLNKHMQMGLLLPYVINTNDDALKKSGSNLGDISFSARYEFFHEYQLRKNSSGKKTIDSKTPYLAIIAGVVIPTGKSDETAENDVDITGKGFYSTSLGVSVIKSIVRNRFQLSADFSWQHSFSNKYESYLGGPAAFGTKQAGDKFNYSMTANYIFSSEHAVSFTTSGFVQGDYKIDDKATNNSDERVMNFIVAYTYYPHVQFRVTPSLKFVLPSNNMGRNATGSTTFNINFTYYIPDYSIK